MNLASAPESLDCSTCGEQITDEGYVPATEREAGYEPAVEDAVCDACGFNEVGMMGCAPELDDIDTTGAADVLLYVRRTDGGLEVVSVKE